MVLIFFSVVKVVKCLILVGLLEVVIEVILVIFGCFLIGNLIFWSRDVDGTDMPFLASGNLS